MCECNQVQTQSHELSTQNAYPVKGGFSSIPVVLLTEGVHHGNNGPIFYSKEALSQSAPLWEDKPVYVNHPKEWEAPKKIGVIYNARMSGRRLVGDLMIDMKTAQKVDHRVYDAIMSKKPMEVSTGLDGPIKSASGVYNGKAYELSMSVIRPDHLAILPDIKGACSIADGCGTLVSNSNVPVLKEEYRRSVPVLNSATPPPVDDGLAIPVLNQSDYAAMSPRVAQAFGTFPPEVEDKLRNWSSQEAVQNSQTSTPTDEGLSMPTIDWDALSPKVAARKNRS